jgi:hypothetical protein
MPFTADKTAPLIAAIHKEWRLNRSLNGGFTVTPSGPGASRGGC